MFGVLGKWFGGGKGESSAEKAPGATVEYEGYQIVPEPYRNGGQWQLAAHIRKHVDGETKEHFLVRADQFTDAEQAQQQAVRKARLVIDERGDGLFD